MFEFFFFVCFTIFLFYSFIVILNSLEVDTHASEYILFCAKVISGRVLLLWYRLFWDIIVYSDMFNVIFLYRSARIFSGVFLVGVVVFIGVY